jgi:orotidine-5'-phosphate decarboxylase
MTDASFARKLDDSMRRNRSLLCVGLDPPQELVERLGFGSFADYNAAIVDATHPYVCAYKPQFAHYAAVGREADLEATITAIHAHPQGVPVILDAKRGDIGNTASQYAREAFERYRADAVTVNPYMGLDTLQPFVRHADRGVIVLVKTSNAGSSDFQDLELRSGEPLYLAVARAVAGLGANVAFVIGATYPDQLRRLRSQFPETLFLVPGIGAQGGDLAQVIAAGVDRRGRGLVINASRSILQANDGVGGRAIYFAEVGQAARALRDAIDQLLRDHAACSPS